jgi:hypothetical protein
LRGSTDIRSGPVTLGLGRETILIASDDARRPADFVPARESGL